MHPDWQTELLKYCETHSSAEPQHLRELVRFTWLNTVNPRQLSGHLQGRLLSLLSLLYRPHCILEIGTFTGYSALCLAEGLEEDGMVHTIEADPELAWKASEFIGTTSFSRKIKIHRGRALDIIPELNIEPELIFVDAGKQEYRMYCDACLPLLKPGGIMIFDNTLWSMKVLKEDERENDADTAAMHNFNEYVAGLKAVSVLMLPLRDGLTILRKN